ncbi:hypothetical protein [Caldicellulosiruptor acetigenus]|uniref:hypothetical protein n=1 Tax=Caldicellulosiruptor acetigenus TaxID=301953 RepID=UPI0005A0331D|nr:hypothetical protein [Caldicellulosiruptor acetigenus]
MYQGFDGYTQKGKKQGKKGNKPTKAYSIKTWWLYANKKSIFRLQNPEGKKGEKVSEISNTKALVAIQTRGKKS